MRSKKSKDQVYSWTPIQFASPKTQITKQSKPSWTSMEYHLSSLSTIKTSRILHVLDMKAKRPSVVSSHNVTSMASDSMMKRYHLEWQASRNLSTIKSQIHSIPLLVTLIRFFKVVKIYWYRIKFKKFPSSPTPKSSSDSYRSKILSNTNQWIWPIKIHQEDYSLEPQSEPIKTISNVPQP